MAMRAFRRQLAASTKRRVRQAQRAKRRSQLQGMRSRTLRHEALEGRVLLATGPQLFAIRPNEGGLFQADADNLLRVAPQELDLLFKGGADINENTLAGIRITRAGANGRFDVASTTTDFGTGGQVVVDLEARNLGAAFNGIELALTESDRGPAAGPRVTVAGVRVTVDLNRNAANKTTAGQLVEALAGDPAASGLLTARIAGGLAAVPEDVPLTDRILDPASGVTSFGLGDYEVTFTAIRSGGAGTSIRVAVVEQALGAGAGPAVTVAGSTVTVALNTTAGSESSVQDVVDAVNAYAAANPGTALVLAELVPTDLLASAPATYQPITLAGGANQSAPASVASDLGTADRVDIRFAAVTPGVAGNGVQIQFLTAARGAAQPPAVLLVTPTVVRVTLNTTPGSETTADQLVSAINGDVAVSAVLSAAVTSPAGSGFTGLINAFTLAHPTLTTAGGGDTAAEAKSDFGTSWHVRFVSQLAGADGNGTVIAVQQQAGALVAVDLPGKRVTIHLDPANPPSPAQLVNELNFVAGALMRTEAVSADAILATDGDPAVYSPVALGLPAGADARDQFGPLTLTDAGQAWVQSDFGAVNPLRIRLSARDAGSAGNGISLQVISRPLGVGAAPVVQVVNRSVFVELNSTAGSETRGQQLIDALLDPANGVTSLVDEVKLLFGDPQEVLGGRPNTFSPLVLQGGDDLVVTPGYIGLPEDDPGDPGDTPNRNEVIVRFAETLADDLYRLEIFARDSAAQGTVALRNRGGDPFQPSNPAADREVLDFNLELGAQVIALVPQPVTRNVQHVGILGPGPAGGDFQLTLADKTTAPISALATAAELQAALEALDSILPGEVAVAGAPGDWTVAFHGRLNYQSVPLLVSDDAAVVVVSAETLHQAEDQVVVYFNNDDLHGEPVWTTGAAGDPTVVRPEFYQLVLTQDTARNTDDVVFHPTSVSYDPGLDLAILTFDAPLTQLVAPGGSGPIGAGTFRLRIGTNDTLPLAPRSVTVGSDPGSSFGAAFDLASQFDIGPAIQVTGSGASVNESTITITDVAGASRTFQFDDPSVGGGAEANRQVVYESGDGSATASTSAAIAQALRDAINAAQAAGEIQVTATASGSRVILSGERSVLPGFDLTGVSAGTQAITLSQEIRNASSGDPTYRLDFPGDENEPGHRDIMAESHWLTRRPTADTATGVATITYHFDNQTSYGSDLSGRPLFNNITDAQKQRAREIFEIYASYFGFQAVETQNSGNWIITGEFDAAIINQFEASAPGGVAGVGGPGRLVMDIAENWNDSFAENWFGVAFHEIGHMLWQGHTYELPPGTIMGSTGTLSFGQGTETFFPGLHDIVHGQQIYRPESKDIDLYRFQVPAGSAGIFTAETLAERRTNSSNLDTLLRLYRETASGRELVSQNDDYYGEDSYIELRLEPGTYYLGVSASGNDEYDPSIRDSGFNGTTEGGYDLKLNFRPESQASIVDAAGTPLDGDGDGQAGGEHNFWFRAATARTGAASPAAETIYVDKAHVETAGPRGTIDNPYRELDTAIATAGPGDIVRAVGNFGTDDDLGTLGDNFAYELGRGGPLDQPLDDGSTLNVPKDVVVMVDAGALVKLRQSRIGVGSSPTTVDRSGGALQVLGTPEFSVIFTSYNDEAIGFDTNPLITTPAAGDWGGLEFRRDVDNSEGRPGPERRGIFLNYVNHADIRYGGGQVSVDSETRVFTPITVLQTRPTITYNTITRSADAAMSADPDSFGETNFNEASYQLSGAYTSDYVRIGPDIQGNRIVNNSVNGLFIRIETPAGGELQPMTVPGRFNDTDIVHVLAENFVIRGTPSGAFVESVKPTTSLITYTPPGAAGTLNPTSTYAYRITFVDALGYEGVPSDPTLSVRPTDIAAGATALTLNTLPRVTGEARSRRLYRSENGGAYQLVAEMDGKTTTYTDHGSLLGGTLSVTTLLQRPRPDARLVVDPGTVIKTQGAMIKAEVGAQLIAEGREGHPIVFTARTDDRYGAGGTFDTNNDGLNAAAVTPPQEGTWAGIHVRPSSTVSLDHVVVAYAGGETDLGGTFASFNALEVHQAEARITNSIFEYNAAGTGGQAGSNRDGHTANAAAVVFVRAAQPVIVDNVFRHNRDTRTGVQTPVISVNVNSLDSVPKDDYGRSRGEIGRFEDFAGNRGPLVRDNKLDDNEINGMQIRGETLQTESVWDDTDVVHVMINTRVFVPDFHVYGGLRLQSSPAESLVVKLQGNAGFVSTGRPLDIEDRIGGMLHIVGSPGFPVVLTSLADDTAGAGVDQKGKPQTDTNGNGASSGAPGQWDGVLIDQYSHDRNVELATELESPLIAAPGQNALPGTAQFLGSLATSEKSGDDFLRLGFVVHGLLTRPNDVDVYSFRATPGTEVWLDLDRTAHALDAVLELIDANGQIIAQSDQSVSESTGALALVANAAEIPTNHVNVLQKTSYYNTHVANAALPKDSWSTNQRDAGLRVVLPGTGTGTSTYHVRVRSSNIDRLGGGDPADLQDPGKVLDGLTAGTYQLQIRLRETDEFAGSTVRYADIRYATTGIAVRGMPVHSPLAGEEAENESGTQNLGNVLNSDRGAIAVAGRIDAADDVDYYDFQVWYDSIQSANGSKWVPTVFDIDYANGIGRPDTTLSVFDAQGRLVLSGIDSNIWDDQPGPLRADDMSDLARGSAGTLDPFIGTVMLPEGNYTVAVSNNRQIPAQLQQFQNADAANPLLRVEPVNSVERLFEDRISGTGGSNVVGSPTMGLLFDDPNTAGTSSAEGALPFHLGDVVLFVSEGVGRFGTNSSTVSIVNPFTGFHEAYLGSFSLRNRDIAMQPYGMLHTFSTGPNTGTANQGNIGNFLQIDTGTAAVTNLGDDGISMFYRDNNGNVASAGDSGYAFNAIAFRDEEGTNLFAIGDRIGQQHPADPTNLIRYRTNVLFRFDAWTGAVDSPFDDRTGDARADAGAGTVQREIGQVTVGGVPLTTSITGTAFIEGTLYAVDNEGNLYSVNTGNASATLLANLPTTFGVGGTFNLQGLSAAPDAVEGGRYRNVLFAIERDGTIYAFYARNEPSTPAVETAGTPAPVFVDGQTSVETGITSAVGLAFSTMDRNLWHVTNDRRDDAGHGVNVPFDNSRTASNGGNSLYFGIEDRQDVAADNTLHETRVDGSNNRQTQQERAPGGAHGSMISRAFSLESYSPEDRPAMYFSYLLDTERVSDVLTDNILMRDAFRVYISGADGLWHVLSTNNDGRAGGGGNDEYDFGSNPNYEYTGDVQNTFDVTYDANGNPNFGWRQARISLADYAGQKDLRIRFVFSTAGGLSLGHALTAGDELYVVPGNQLRDGQTFAIDGQTFEFDMGYTLVAPTGANLDAGENFTITHGGTTRTLTFVDAITGANQILIDAQDNANDVATKVRAALLTAFPGMPIYRDGYRLNIPTATAFTLSAGLPASFREGAPGISLISDVEVDVHAGMPAYSQANANNMTAGNDVRAQIVQAMAATFSANPVDPIVDPVQWGYNVAAVKTHQHVIQVVGRNVTVQGPLGLARRNGTTNGLPNDQFGVLYTTPANQGTASTRFNVQGIANDIQGVYVDDIIIGFAERGEMVVNAQADATGFADNAQGTSSTATGQYQLEIRQGAAYAWTNPNSPPQLLLDRSYDTNERLAEQITFLAPAGYLVHDGQTFVLGDGVDTLTFEYEDLDLPAGSPNKGFAPGNVPVNFRITSTADEVAESIRDAINSAPVQAVLDLRAGLSDGRNSGATSTSRQVNLYGNAVSDRMGNRNFGEIDDTVTATADYVAHGRNTLGPGSIARQDLGDQNLHREQGQLLIQSNVVRQSSGYGIVVDAGVRGSTAFGTDVVPRAGDTAPHPGSVRNLRVINTDRLVPGVTVMNNLITANTNGGIRFSGDPASSGANPPGPVPFGRIVNNTIYGTRSGDTGILVEESTSPTLLNNILANLATGVSVDASSSSTQLGANLFQNNGANVAGVSTGAFAITLTPGQPLFVNAGAGNFYLATGSQAIDSSLASLADRTDYVNVKSPLGLPPSPIVSPELDVFGQLRVDDPLVNTPPGQGANVFLDRGALDRADFGERKPSAQLANPLDNDGFGRDRDPNPAVVLLPDGVLSDFTILLLDEGTGVDPATVNTSTVTLRQNGRLLVEGVDFVLGYNAGNQTLILTPLSEVWEPDSIYQITLNNRVIADRAGNLLRSNQPDGQTQFNILIGSVSVDFGDAPASFGTALINDGARHVLLPGTPRLGQQADAEADAVPGPGADSDDLDGAVDDEDGIVFGVTLADGSLHPGVFNASKSATPITATVSGSGWLDGWVDFNGNGLFDTLERLFFYDSESAAVSGGYANGSSKRLSQGEHTLWVVSPSWTAAQDPVNDRAARFRIRSDAPGFSATAPFFATSLVLGGEVEDYVVQVARGKPPVAVNDQYFVEEDPNEPDSAVTLPTVLGNDTDADGVVDVPVSVLLISGPTKAREFLLHPGGSFDYLPELNFHGQDTFTYRAVDGTGLTSNNVATVTITTLAKNDPPEIQLPGSLPLPVEDQDLVIRGIVVADLDSLLTPGLTVAATVAVGQGTLQLGNASVVTITAGAEGTPTITFRGTLAQVNQALDGLRYRGRQDYNSGNPAAGSLIPDLLTLHVDDLNGMTDPSLPAEPMTARSTITLTVQPDNDRPTVVNVDAGTTIDEDGSYQIPRVATVGDVDESRDPLWVGQVTLTVQHGTLTLDTANLPAGLQFPDIVGGNYDGVPAKSIRFRGTTSALNPALLNVFYQADRDYHSGNPATSAVVPDKVVVTIDDLGNTDADGVPGPLTASGTVPITVRPDNDPPRLESVVADSHVNEDTNWVIPVVATVEDVDAAFDPAWTGELILTVAHGTLLLTNVAPGLSFPDLGGAYDNQPAKTIKVVGLRADLNAALSQVVYRGEQDYNSGNPAAGNVVPDTLVIRLNDLNSTDVDSTPGPLSVDPPVTVTITVDPINDAPRLENLAANQTLPEDSSVSIATLATVEDVDIAYDPLWEGSVTLTVAHGTLLLTTVPAGLDFPALGGSYNSLPAKSVTFVGTRGELNAALQSVLYAGDADDNSGTPVNPALQDRIQITIDDLKHTDIDPAAASRTDSESVTVTIQPRQDDPVIEAKPANFSVGEDTASAPLVFRVFDVDARSADGSLVFDPGWTGRVILAATYGTIQVASASGVTVVGAGTDRVTLEGSLDGLNTALAGVVYRGKPNFNSGSPVIASLLDSLVITLDDLGHTDAQGAASNPAVGAVTITVDPLQDPIDLVAVPGSRSVDEDARLTLPPIALADVDYSGSVRLPDGSTSSPVYDPGWVGEVQLSVKRGRLWLASTAGITITTGAEGTGGLTFRGLFADLKAALAAVEYQGNADYNSGHPVLTPTQVTPDELQIVVRDLGNTALDPGAPATSDAANVAILVRPINDAPVVDVSAVTHTTVAEEAPLSLAGVRIQDVDEWNGLEPADRPAQPPFDAQLEVTLVAANGTLRVRTNVSGGVPQLDIVNNGTSRVILFGTVDQINTTLTAFDGLVYTGNLNFNGPETVVIQADDDGRNRDDAGSFGSYPGDALAGAATIALTVTPVNDAPVITLPAPPFALENTDLAITGVTIQDVDAIDVPGMILEVTLSVLQGKLTLAGTPPFGLTFLTGDGVADPSMRFRGTSAAIAAAIDGMIYRGNLDFNGADELTVLVADLGNTGAPGVNLTDREVLVINVGAENNPPTVSVAGVGNTTTDEDLDLPLPGIVVGDPDTSFGVVNLTVTMTVNQGRLTVSPGIAGGLGSTQIQGNGSGLVRVTGTPAQINATFAAATGVVYRGNLNFNGNDALVIVANDNGNIGAGGPKQSVPATIPLTVRAVNDAPVVDLPPGARVIDEDTAAYIPLIVSDVDAGETGGGPIVVTLSAGNGTLLVRSDVSGGLNAGAIQNNGTSTVTLTGTPAAITATLLNSTGLQYAPKANWNGSDQLVIAANDQGYTGQGPAGGLVTRRTVPITVNAINDDPQFVTVPGGRVLDEGPSASVAITGWQIADVDAADAVPGPGHIRLSLAVPTGAGRLQVAADRPSGVPASRIAGNGGAAVVLTGTVAEINATLADAMGVTYAVPDGDFNSSLHGGNVLLTATLNDLGNTGGGTHASGFDVSRTVDITVRPINDPPTVTAAAATRTLNEGVGSRAILTDLRIQDVDAREANPQAIQASLAIPAGVGSIAVIPNVAGGVPAARITNITNGSGQRILLDGTVSEINATLAGGVTYTVPDGDFNSNRYGGPVPLVVQVDDLGKSGFDPDNPALPSPPKTGSLTVQLTVVAINDDPVVTVPAAAQAVDEDRSLFFQAAGGNAIVVADADAAEGTGELRLTLAGSNGVLTLGSIPAGLTFLSGDGADDAVMQFRGTLAAINAALEGLEFRPNTDFNGAATLTVTANDLGNSGGGTSSGGANVSRTVGIAVRALNDAPEITVNPTGPLQAVEDQPLFITALRTSDVDVAETPGGQLVVTMTVDAGTLTLATNVPGGLQPADVSGNGTGTVILSGTPNRINATLGHPTGLTYLGGSGFSGAATLIVTADDQGATGVGGPLSDRETVTIQVREVNDAPVVTVPGGQNMQEDGTLNLPGISVFDADLGSGDVRVTLQVPAGSLVVQDNVAGGVSAGAIQNNGSSQVVLTGPMAAINATLASAMGLRFTPAQHASGQVVLTVTANDLAAVDPQQGQATIAVSIAAINDPPGLTVPAGQPLAVNEDTSLKVLGVSVADVDAGSGNLRLQIQAVNGRVTVANNVTGGVPAANISNNGTQIVSVTGTVAQLNATLAVGFDYLGLAEFHGAELLTLTVNDLGNSGAGGALTAQDTIRIEVGEVDDLPVANPDTTTTAEDTARTISPATLTSNDSPGAGDQGTQSVRFVGVQAGSPQHGSVVFDGTQIVYTPAANFNGTDTFRYVIDDGNPASTAVGTVTVTVTPVNDPPVPAGYRATINEDTILSIAGSAVIAGDAPGPVAPLGTQDTEVTQTLTLQSVSPTSSRGGSVTFQGGIVVYTPPANANGTDTFTYRVADNGRTNGVSDSRDATGTVTVTIQAVNDGPQVSAAATATVNEDTAGAIPGISVADLDVLESQPATSGELEVTLQVGRGTLAVRSNVMGGVTTVSGNGTSRVNLSGTPAQINATLAAADGLLYTSQQHAQGQDALVITVDDARQTGLPNPASPAVVVRTVSLNIQPVNDPPTITAPVSMTVPEETQVNVGAVQVADVDVTQPAAATFRVTLIADRGMLTVNTALFNGVAPGSVTGNGTGVVTIVDSLAAINVTLGTAGGLRYEPVVDFQGTDFIRVEVDDQGHTGFPGPQQSSRTITVTVTGENDAPIAVDDGAPGDSAFRVDEDSILVAAGRGVLDNDQDPDGDTLAVADEDATPGDGVYRATSSRGIVVSVNVVQGTFQYDPTQAQIFQALSAGQSLQDTFTYRATDGSLLSNRATVTITVTGINDPPLANADNYATNDNAALNTAINVSVPGVLANDSDVEGSPLAVVVAESDAVSRLGATVAIQANGEFVYDPTTSSSLRALQVGDPPLVDHFVYTVADNGGSGARSKATVTITVSGANSNPTPLPDQYSTDENLLLTDAAPGVLENDSDVDSATISVTPRSGLRSTLGATVTLRGNGSFDYDPNTSLTLRGMNSGDVLADTFPYEVVDGQGGSATGTVTVTVRGITDPPNQNPVERTDVNGDGHTSPVDSLILINEINRTGPRVLPVDLPHPPYLDPSGDGNLTPEDVLEVINYLNALAQRTVGAGEGEAVEGSARGLGSAEWIIAAGWMSPAEPTGPSHADRLVPAVSPAPGVVTRSGGVSPQGISDQADNGAKLEPIALALGDLSEESSGVGDDLLESLARSRSKSDVNSAAIDALLRGLFG